MSKIREITINSIDLNPNAEKIINQYKEDLNWLLFELSKISGVQKKYQYSNAIGKITIEII